AGIRKREGRSAVFRTHHQKVTCVRDPLSGPFVLQVCAFNRTVSKVDDFLANEAKGTKVVGAKSLKEMVSKLKKPRRVILLVKAGQAVDDFIEKLVPLLEAGDIIIDGGNSEYRDTTRRCRDLKAKGILFVGSGVSGGEEGARYGPSLMPGGNKEAWPHIKTIFQAIAAKVGTGEPCCDWVGDEGAGHFVKMVHNGIEYGDMQLICEAYHLMKDVLGMRHEEMAQAFEEWNKTELDSFLIEITANILKFLDTDGKELLPKIRDSAGQKGTGKWTAISALDYGMPVTLIGNVVPTTCAFGPTALIWCPSEFLLWTVWRQSLGLLRCQCAFPLSARGELSLWAPRRSCLRSLLVLSEGGASPGQQKAQGPPEDPAGRQ
ncbi:6-phosphogluconate dehydrogenase, decarboxylating, partial [Lemmus lemmus]